MKVESTRFGTLDVAEETLIELSAGMVGFPQDTRFVWVAHRNSQTIAWLQSTSSASIAFPLISAAELADGYPDVPIGKIAEQAGISYEDEEFLALMVVLSPNPQGRPKVNLMAPVVINSQTRQGAQVVLTNSRFTTAELLPKPSTTPVSKEAAR